MRRATPKIARLSGFRSPAGENNFARIGSDASSNLAARVLDPLLRRLAVIMNTGSVTADFRKGMREVSQHFGRDGRGRVVIEVKVLHSFIQCNCSLSNEGFPMKRPVISLLTDFGSSDHYAGTMKGVMLDICPKAQLIDITHDIPAYAIAEAAFTLAQAWRYFPEGTVHLVVVDPGVGSSRRPIIAEAGGHFFVAPDNGVLTMVFDVVKNCRVREITASGFFRKPVSHTFHGRDIFAPVAARLARGITPARFGTRIQDPVRAGFSRPIQNGPKRWTGSVLKVDRFGNLVTNFDSERWRHAGSDSHFG